MNFNFIYFSIPTVHTCKYVRKTFTATLHNDRCVLKKKKRKEIFVTYKIVCAKREESILRKNLKFTNYGSLFIIHQIA